MPADLWSSIDYPILLAIAEEAEENGGAFYLDRESVKHRSGVHPSEQSFIDSVVRLTDDGYLNSHNHRQGSGDWSLMIKGLTAKGLRVVGSWPTGDFPDLLAHALIELEVSEHDPTRKSRIAALRSAVLGAGREILVDVLAKVAERQVGIS